MGMPNWWDERRLGLFVQASLAAVPAWAPIGMRADGYRTHLGDTDPGAGQTTQPLVEVLAHHRDRWGHIERYDDFVPLLRFNDFDAEAWARLAVDAGAGYAAVVARDQDGWVWWDAPTTTRTMVTNGPHRNVIADFASACERNGLSMGAYYAATGVGDTGGDPSLALHDVVDLVDRFGIEFLRFDAQGTGGPSDQMLAQILAAQPDLVVDIDAARSPVTANERAATVRTHAGRTPPDIVEEPWELRRDLGTGLGHNRAERAEHLLSAHDIVALLTEVVAKGGHLLLSVGATADGAIPDAQAAPLRTAGEWIRRHRRLIDAGRPWTSWGDDDTRFIEVDGVLHAVDVTGRGHFAGLTSQRYRVDSVDVEGSPIPFRQDDEGLHLDLHRLILSTDHDPERIDISVYRLALSEPERPAGLFDTSPRQPIELGALLRNAATGDIVQLGDGTYLGPVAIPPGVTIRGLGGSRTVLDPGQEPVSIGANARLEHLRVSRSDR
ncbi:MAG: alpha-L-fucosidase, partial [Ilumatobacteraceae bacterium]